jgi:hypothetical protein
MLIAVVCVRCAAVLLLHCYAVAQELKARESEVRVGLGLVQSLVATARAESNRVMTRRDGLRSTLQSLIPLRSMCEDIVQKVTSNALRDTLNESELLRMQLYHLLDAKIEVGTQAPASLPFPTCLC